jgi:uncharacterized protein YkwD
MNAWIRTLLALTLPIAMLALARPALSRPDEKAEKKVEKLDVKPDEEKKAPKLDVDDRALSTDEKGLLDAINDYRKESILKGNVPLVVEANLVKGCRAQATTLARKAEVSEASGKENFSRIVGAAFAKERIVKMVAWTEGYCPPETVLEILLKDKDNRTKLLDPSFRAAGVGIVRTSRSEYYYTISFLAPEAP